MDAKAAEGSRFASIGRALRHRNYRLFFAGQSVSLVGTWLTRVATSWLVYRITGSTVLLGVVGFAGQIPTFLIAPFAGVWIDRWNRHRVLVVTQVLAMLQSAALAALALTERESIPAIIALSVFQGVINAFDVPARQSFVVQMIEHRADLPNAIALNSSMVNAARLLGPSVAGVLIGAVGEGYCFLVDALSYVAVVTSLLLMRLPPPPPRKPAEPMIRQLTEGWHYVSRFVPIRSVLLLLALVSFMGMPYTVLMPAVATRVLAGGPHTLGFLMAGSGIGALTGTLYLASRKTVLGLGRIIGIAAAVFGGCLVLFSLSRSFALSFFLLIPVGLGMMIQMAASNTILQTVTDEDKRGRVMSFFTMAFFGTVPFGSLFAGTLAEVLSVPTTIMIGGIACMIGSALFFRALPEIRAAARPVYIKLGIIPEVPEKLGKVPEVPTEE